MNTAQRIEAMKAAASVMAVAIGNAEKKAAKSAKEWGTEILNLVKGDNFDIDELIDDTRAAIGWPKLAGDAGKAIKRKFNVWATEVRFVSGRWSKLEPAVRDELLKGDRSFLSLAKTLHDDDRAAAKAEADKAKGDGDTSTDTDNAAPPSLSDMVTALIDAYGKADQAAKDEAHPFLEMLFDAVNADVAEHDGVGIVEGNADEAFKQAA